MKSPKQIAASFSHAFRGIWQATKEETNLKIHFVLGIFIVILGVFYSLNATEWILILLCISAVITTELLNTAIEKLADRVTKENDLLIKAAKDMAAGAVLVSAITSVIVASLIFIPKFIS